MFDIKHQPALFLVDVRLYIPFEQTLISYTQQLILEKIKDFIKFARFKFSLALIFADNEGGYVFEKTLIGHIQWLSLGNI